MVLPLHLMFNCLCAFAADSARLQFQQYHCLARSPEAGKQMVLQAMQASVVLMHIPRKGVRQGCLAFMCDAIRVVSSLNRAQHSKWGSSMQTHVQQISIAICLLRSYLLLRSRETIVIVQARAELAAGLVRTCGPHVTRDHRRSMIYKLLLHAHIMTPLTCVFRARLAPITQPFCC